MGEKQSWEAFRECGLLWWVNRSLHLFGWALVIVLSEDGSVIEAYPARVKFRGFDEKSESEGFVKLTKYMVTSAEQLSNEMKAQI